MSKFEFEKIPLGETRFYKIERHQSAYLRMMACDWVTRQKNWVKLSCKQAVERDIHGNKIFLGMNVTRVE
jgi:hypothetical protein